MPSECPSSVELTPPANLDAVGTVRLSWLLRSGVIDQRECDALLSTGRPSHEICENLYLDGRLERIPYEILLGMTERTTLIGPFATVGVIGEGAMGRVHLARHVERGTLAAVKAIRVDKAAIQRLQRRFQQEVRLLHTIDHPAIARLYAWDLLADPPWLAMEYVRGLTLDDLVVRIG
ncbi:MAG: protein kinase domain-containing protein, partial [Planctomycetota bacterium]